MTDSEPDMLGERLAALAGRIEARMRELRDRGEFADSQESFLENLRSRHAALREKLEKAVKQGKAWELVKSEIALDVDSLIDELVRWERRLDAGEMRDAGDGAGS